MDGEMNAARFTIGRALGGIAAVVLLALLAACGGSDDMTDRQASPDASTSPASAIEMSVSPDTSLSKRD